MKRVLTVLCAVLCLTLGACGSKANAEGFESTAKDLGYSTKKISNEYTNDTGTFVSAVKDGVTIVCADMEKEEGAENLFDFQKTVIGYGNVLTGNGADVQKVGNAEYAELDTAVGYALVLRSGKCVIIVAASAGKRSEALSFLKKLGYNIK